MRERSCDMNKIKICKIKAAKDNKLLVSLCDSIRFSNSKISIVIVAVAVIGLVLNKQVKVTKKTSKSNDEQLIRYLQRGEFFGERALQG